MKEGADGAMEVELTPVEECNYGRPEVWRYDVSTGEFLREDPPEPDHVVGGNDD
jgi:hypothetical protein